MSNEEEKLIEITDCTSKNNEDDFEKGRRRGYFDLYDDDTDKGNDPEDREDLTPEVHAPLEIKTMRMKITRKDAGLADLVDGEAAPLSDLTPKKVVKEEAVPGAAKTETPTKLKSPNIKRKLNGDDSKTPYIFPPKNVKMENKTKHSIKTENGSGNGSSALSTGQVQSTKPISEEEVRAVIAQPTPITTQELAAKLKAWLKTNEEKKSLAEILRRISKIQKTRGHSYVVLKDRV